jgi:hypothetical protein
MTTVNGLLSLIETLELDDLMKVCRRMHELIEIHEIAKREDEMLDHLAKWSVNAIPDIKSYTYSSTRTGTFQQNKFTLGINHGDISEERKIDFNVSHTIETDDYSHLDAVCEFFDVRIVYSHATGTFSWLPLRNALDKCEDLKAILPPAWTNEKVFDFIKDVLECSMKNLYRHNETDTEDGVEPESTETETETKPVEAKETKTETDTKPVEMETNTKTEKEADSEESPMGEKETTSVPE